MGSSDGLLGILLRGLPFPRETGRAGTTRGSCLPAYSTFNRQRDVLVLGEQLDARDQGVCAGSLVLRLIRTFEG